MACGVEAWHMWMCMSEFADSKTSPAVLRLEILVLDPSNTLAVCFERLSL